MPTQRIPTDGLSFQWGRLKFVLSGRAVYLALLLGAGLAALYLLKH
jgi:hypothetical protein